MQRASCHTESVTQSYNRLLLRIQAFRHDDMSLGERLPMSVNNVNDSETLVTTQQTARHIPQDLILLLNLAKADYTHTHTQSIILRPDCPLHCTCKFKNENTSEFSRCKFVTLPSWNCSAQ